MVQARPLTVKGSIKNAVEGVSEHHGRTGKMAPFTVETSALDQLLTECFLLGTFCVAFHTSTEGRVDRGPAFSILKYLITKLTHFKVLWGHSWESLYVRPASLPATRLGTLHTLHTREAIAACMS